MEIIIEVKVVPNSKKSQVEEVDKLKFKIHVMAPAVDGKANKALIEVLADYFKTKKNKISIVRGETGRTKIVKIESRNLS